MKSVDINSNYNVCPQGQVFNAKTGRKLKPFKINTGYFAVSLWRNNKGNNYTIHRLVANAYIPNPDGLEEVNHIDGNKLNNEVSNLEWVSSSGNSYHAVNTGLRTYTNRLTQAQFEECLDKVINGMSYQELSRYVPYKVPYLSTKLRSIARKLSKESLLDDSLQKQRVERAIKNLESINK